MKKFTLMILLAMFVLPMSAQISKSIAPYASGKVKETESLNFKVSRQINQATPSLRTPVTEEPDGEKMYYTRSGNAIIVDGGYYTPVEQDGEAELIYAKDGTVWFKNLPYLCGDYYGDSYVYGTLSADGTTISIPMGQSIYYSDSYSADVVLAWGTTAVSGSSLVFTVDETVTEAVFAINDNTLTLQNSQSAPSGSGYDQYEGTGIGCYWTDDNSFGAYIEWNTVLTLIVNKPTIPTDVAVTPTTTTGEVVWMPGENNGSWNLRWRPYVDPISTNRLWDLPLDGYEEQVEGWSLYDADGDGNTWGLAYSSDANDDVCFYSASYEGGVLTPDNWLMTPDVMLGGTLKFDTWNRSSYYPDKIMVYVGSWDTLTSLDNMIPLTDDFIQPGATAESFEIDLSKYEGVGFIAFRHYDCEDQWMIYIDNIEVTVPNPQVIPDWTLVQNASNPYTITGLTPSTEYEVQVMAFNPAGDQYTDWTASVYFTTLDQAFTKHIVGYGGGTGKNGYYFIASPVDDVDPTTVDGMIDGDYDLYYFDQSQPQEEWQNYKENDFPLGAPWGYLYAKATDVDLVITGTPYCTADNFAIALTKVTGAEMEGWNLMGNPFGVQVYIDHPYYILEGTDNYVEKTADDPIEVMQGFLVEATEDGEVLVFSTEKPTTKSATLALNVTNGNDLVDRATVCFGEGRNLGKLNFRENSSKLYMTEDNKDYAVVCTEEQGEMPVSFKAENNGTYTLSFNTENIEMGYLHLIDNMTGNDVDLLATPSYTFSAKTTDYASRFRLVFAAGNNNDLFAFLSNGEIILNGVNDNTAVQLFDVTGRMLNNTNGINRISTENMAAGIYTVRLINGNEVKTQKIVVK